MTGALLLPAARSSLTALALASCLLACTTTRGRADAALERGDYRGAIDLYAKIVARDPSDAEARALLTRAERGLLDQVLGRVDAARRASKTSEALRAGLEALQTKDGVHGEAVDAPRQARFVALVDWAGGAIRASIEGETAYGRALAARARRASFASWLARPELTKLGPALDAAIAKAGAKTCTHAAVTAGEQPFTLELVAAYCKEVGGQMPPWRARPLLVGGVVLEGTIRGTPADEQAALARAVSEAVERSVWFSPTSSPRAVATLEGSVSSVFTRQPTELTRSWAERVPYQAIEAYTEPVEVPYMDVETYTEKIPYTAYEDRLEPCAPPRKGLCNESHPVMRYRDETRQRKVKRFRTEYQERTREVTRYRDEPRVFRYTAQKHEGRYRATFEVRVDLDASLRPVATHAAAEDSQIAYEHDAEFAPAGVHPERGTLPSAASWRRAQRERLRTDLLRALDAGWVEAFCSESVATIEEASRCARARPSPPPAAVRARITELFGDSPDLVLALPRPREVVAREVVDGEVVD